MVEQDTIFKTGGASPSPTFLWQDVTISDNTHQAK